MASHEHIVHVLARIHVRQVRTIDHIGKAVENLDAGFLQFNAHQHRQQPADDARENCKPQIHRADVLVVGGIDVTAPTRRVSVVIVMCGV